MPFILANFQPIGGQSKAGSAPQRFSYKTEDAQTTVDGAGYFNAVRDSLFVGDIIDVVVVNSSNVVQTYGPHIVMTKSATAVDVSNVTTGTVTNSD